MNMYTSTHLSIKQGINNCTNNPAARGSRREMSHMCCHCGGGCYYCMVAGKMLRLGCRSHMLWSSSWQVCSQVLQKWGLTLHLTLSRNMLPKTFLCFLKLLLMGPFVSPFKGDPSPHLHSPSPATGPWFPMSPPGLSLISSSRFSREQNTSNISKMACYWRIHS